MSLIIKQAIKMLLMAGAMVFFVSGEILAETATGVENPMEFRKIMQTLGRNMQVITEGISRTNWRQVEDAAIKVADHPTPPLTEKIRILAFAGSNVGKFKRYDGATHDTAKALAALAIEQDGKAVIATFAKLQNACLACHQEFRESFKAHFYSK